MSRFSAICGLLLAATPLAGRAQAIAPATPHFYVGLAAYASNYLPLGRLAQGNFPLPLQATAGYQLSPRWAMQLSGAYSGRSNSYSQTLYEAGPHNTNVPYSYAGAYRQRLYTTSALVRYTLTRPAAHRLQVEVLAGLAWVHTTYRDNYAYTDTAGVTTTNNNLYRTNHLLLNAGLGARYRFTPRLEATYNFLVGLPLAGYNAGGLQPSMALGLHYHLGRR